MKRRWPLIGLVLLLSIPLFILLRGFSREVAAAELLRLHWAGRILLESLPQAPLWWFFLFVVLVVSASSLVKRRRVRRVELQGTRTYRGSVRALTRLIRLASEGRHSRWRLARRLGELAVDAKAFRDRTTPSEVIARLRSGEAEVPGCVRACLGGGSPPSPRYRGLVAMLRRGAPAGSHVDLDLEGVVRFLENQLEV